VFHESAKSVHPFQPMFGVQMTQNGIAKNLDIDYFLENPLLVIYYLTFLHLPISLPRSPLSFFLLP